MKRGRKSMAFNIGRNGTKAGGFGHILINYSGPSFSYLPRDIMFNVLLRLSVKRILACKFVCKTWYDLVSDPEFARLHLDQAQAYPLIQISHDRTQSRLLYLVQPEEDFELKLERCDHSEYNCKCDCHVKFELDTKFKLPLRNLEMIYDGNMLDHVGGEESNNCIRLNMKNHKYHVVNSCNGLLCLSSPTDSYPLAVCNPVTGEFINLAKAPTAVPSWAVLGYGLGFSPTTNKYIVIRVFCRGALDMKNIAAEVHTLGTETWKEVDISTHLSPKSLPIYLNGFLYWPCRLRSQAQTYCATSFDIENECFGLISPPPMDSMPPSCSETKVGALGGELSMSCYFPSGAIAVWVLKDYGSTKAWSKVFSIQSENERWPFHYCPFRPIKFLNDGALLMFHSYTNSLIYAHPEKQRFRYFKITGSSAELEAIAHIPSFVPLKDALSGHNVKVLKSRCAELKLQHEAASFSVIEKDIQGLRRR